MQAWTKPKDGQEGRAMKFTTLLKNSIGTAVLAGALFIAPAAANARVFVSVAIAPPAIPVYAQPIAPGDGYIWTPGYWGPTIGYYGGINYGFGYFGTGFYGGYWGGGRFFYNRAYCNIGYGHGFHNVYNRPYGGYNGRPSGSSWAHNGYNGGNRGSYVGGNHFDGNRGRFDGNRGGSNFADNHGSNFGGRDNAVNRGG